MFIFRERGRDRERWGEKHQYVVASCMPPTGDLACNLGLCPDWDSTSDLLFHRPGNLLISKLPSQGNLLIFKNYIVLVLKLLKYHLAVITIIIDSGKKHQWMPKIIGQSLMRKIIFTQLQREKIVALLWRNLTGTSSKWPKLSPVLWKIDILCLLVWCTTGHHFCVIPVKNAWPEFNHEKTPDKPRLKNSTK